MRQWCIFSPDLWHLYEERELEPKWSIKPTTIYYRGKEGEKRIAKEAFRKLYKLLRDRKIVHEIKTIVMNCCLIPTWLLMLDNFLTRWRDLKWPSTEECREWREQCMLVRESFKGNRNNKGNVVNMQKVKSNILWCIITKGVENWWKEKNGEAGNKLL